MRKPTSAGVPHGTLSPAEPEERAAIAARALAERADETGAGNGAAPGESPQSAPVEAAPIRDVQADKASLAAFVEVVTSAGARIVAARWPQTVLTVRTVLDKSGSFAKEAGERFGAAVGEKLPRALPMVGGICGMLAWWLRSLPLPEVPPSPAKTMPPPTADAVSTFGGAA